MSGRRSRWTAWLLALAVVLLASTAAAGKSDKGSASADKKDAAAADASEQADATEPSPEDVKAREESEQIVAHAVELQEAGDDAGAIGELKKAYERFPNPHVHFKLGQLYVKTGNAREAVRSFERYLEEGGDNVPTARRDRILEDLTDLRKQLGRVTIRTKAKKGVIEVDGERETELPASDPILVRPGKRTITLVLPDGRRVDATIEVATGSSATARLDPTEAEFQTPKADKGSKGSSKALVYVGWSATAVLAAGAVVSLIVAQGHLSDYQEKKDTFGVSPDDLESSQSSAKTWTFIGAGLGAAAVVTGGLSLYATLKRPASKTGKARREHMQVGFGPASVVIRGVF